MENQPLSPNSGISHNKEDVVVFLEFDKKLRKFVPCAPSQKYGILMQMNGILTEVSSIEYYTRTETEIEIFFKKSVDEKNKAAITETFEISKQTASQMARIKRNHPKKERRLYHGIHSW